MEDDSIPDDVRNFIFRHIDSVTQLEALLLLHRMPDEYWDVAKTAKRLYASETDVAEVLARLCNDGLLSLNKGVYRYDCKIEDKRAIVDLLAAVYRKYLISVTNIIHGKPRRIREFADAFRLRKER